MYTVAIVEDDFRIAEINKSFVERAEGFEVVGVALNGKTLIEILEKHNPDLVLLDIYIPDISGQELLLYLKKHYPKTGIIMITAAKEIKNLEFFLQHGVFDYLVKPVDEKRLHMSLRKYGTFKEKVTEEIELEQEDIDEIMDRSKIINDNGDGCPKGIDPLTLDKVINFVKAENDSITIEEARNQLGVSRSTIKRYLDYLVKEGELQVELRYRPVGRPIRVYRLLS